MAPKHCINSLESRRGFIPALGTPVVLAVKWAAPLFSSISLYENTVSAPEIWVIHLLQWAGTLDIWCLSHGNVAGFYCMSSLDMHRSAQNFRQVIYPDHSLVPPSLKWVLKLSVLKCAVCPRLYSWNDLIILGGVHRADIQWQTKTWSFRNSALPQILHSAVRKVSGQQE